MARKSKDTANDRLVQTCLYQANNATTFFRHSTSYEVCQEKYRYKTGSKLENSVLEINHVTNVATVLNETTTSDRVSCFSLAIFPRSLSPLPPPCPWSVWVLSADVCNIQINRLSLRLFRFKSWQFCSECIESVDISVRICLAHTHTHTHIHKHIKTHTQQSTV